jgi:hypothetical protein
MELSLFTPLPRDFCIWFYFLSVIGFAFLAIVLLSTLYIGITKKRDGAFYFQMFTLAVGYLIFYFQNRLLYSMCINSI